MNYEHLQIIFAFSKVFSSLHLSGWWDATEIWETSYNGKLPAFAIIWSKEKVQFIRPHRNSAQITPNLILCSNWNLRGYLSEPYSGGKMHKKLVYGIIRTLFLGESNLDVFLINNKNGNALVGKQ